MDGYAQIEANQQAIDSIQGLFKNSKTKYSVDVANNYYKIGEIFRYSNKNDSAFYYYHKAAKIFEENNLDYELATTYYGIAAIQCYEKDFIFLSCKSKVQREIILT